MGHRLLLEAPLSAAVWDAERSAFAEVADGLALAHVALAYDRLAGAPRILAGWSELAASLERAASGELPADSWRKKAEPYLKDLFEHIEVALVQLDRYSRLAKGPVDYSQLTSGRDL